MRQNDLIQIKFLYKIHPIKMWLATIIIVYGNKHRYAKQRRIARL